MFMAITMYKSIDAAISKVTELEFEEVGYLEKASNASLDSKTENAGYNNYTKYWRDLNQLGIMGQSSNFAGGNVWYWCAGYQSWIFYKAFGLDGARKLLLHMPYITCAVLGEKAKAAGRLYDDPQEGDISLFWNGSRYSHTGYVYAVDSNKFYTVEGNTNSSAGVVANGGGVFKKSYVRSTMKNKGTKFFRPDYSLVVDGKGNTSSNSKPSKPATSSNNSNSTKVIGEAKVTTKTDPLMCRKSASSSASILGKFAKGATVSILAKTNSSWWKVKGKSTDGKTITGYCSTKYLTECADKVSLKITTKTDPLRCRATASSNGKILGKFAKGATVTLVEKTNSSWWKVKGKSTDGKTITGYCSTEYLG